MKVEQRSSKSQEVWGSWGGDVPLPTSQGSGQHCKLPQWGSGESLATWQFRTFYRPTKPVPWGGFKFISVKFLWGLSHRRPHNQIFVGSRPLDQTSTGSAPMLTIHAISVMPVSRSNANDHLCVSDHFTCEPVPEKNTW